MASEETSSLDPTSPNRFGREKERKERGKRRMKGRFLERERESLPSL